MTCEDRASRTGHYSARRIRAERLTGKEGLERRTNFFETRGPTVDCMALTAKRECRGDDDDDDSVVRVLRFFQRVIKTRVVDVARFESLSNFGQTLLSGFGLHRLDAVPYRIADTQYFELKSVLPEFRNHMGLLLENLLAHVEDTNQKELGDPTLAVLKLNERVFRFCMHDRERPVSREWR